MLGFGSTDSVCPGTQRWGVVSKLGRPAGGGEPDTNGVGKRWHVSVLPADGGGGRHILGFSCSQNCRSHTGIKPVRGRSHY